MKYYLSNRFLGEKEVTRDDFIKAERTAGFRPKCASTDPKYWTELATGGFSDGTIDGRILYEPEDLGKLETE